MIELYRRGDFVALKDFVDPRAFDGEECLWIARCYLEKGEPKAAQKFLQAAKLSTNDTERSKAISMQEFCVSAQVSGDISAELRKAEAFWDRDNAQTVLAQAYLVLLRLMAGQVYIGSKVESLRDLGVLIGPLSKISSFMAAHAARWIVLGTDDIEEKTAAARQCMALATEAGFPHVGGEAWIMVAQAGRKVLARRGDIETAIDAAEKAFLDAQYVPGPAIIKRERIKVDILEGRAKSSDLEPLVAEFELCKATGLAHALCSDLANELQQSARATAARKFSDRAQLLARESGMGPALRIDSLNAIERLRSEGKPAEAVKVCDETLAQDLPDLVRGIILQSKARALSAAGSTKAALREIDAAHQKFKTIGAMDYASTLVGEHVLFLTTASRDRRDFEAADGLLVEQEKADFGENRPLQALEKSIYRADTALRAFSAFRQMSDLDEAMAYAKRSYCLADDFPGKIRDQHKARCLQVQAQVYAIRAQAYSQQSDLDAAARSTAQFREANSSAISHSIDADNLIQAAGCAMTAGTVELNTSIDALRRFAGVSHDDRDQRETFDKLRRDSSANAYANFERAEELYRECGLSEPAARSHAFLSEVAANALLFPTLGTPSDLATLFKRHLAEADSLYELRRAELELDRAEDTLLARQELSKQTERLTELALRVFLRDAADLEAFWSWLQKAKARSISDALAFRTADQGSLSLQHARQAISDMPRGVTLVDWSIAAGQVHIVVVSGNDGPIFERIPISQADLTDWIDALTARDYRSSLAGTPQLLQKFSPLVAPLEWLTRPGTLLALSPMGGIGRLPLQALNVRNEPLIRRNPLVVVPNHLLGLDSWHGRQADKEISIFGDPTSDLKDASDVIEHLSTRFTASPALGAEVTADAIQVALSCARVLHYQGHARHDAEDPLASALDLAAGSFAASDILDGEPVSAELVILGACEAGMSQIARGNEPNGLTQAFLIRGVARVISTLWPIEERAANVYVESLYGALDQMHPADAHRSAVLSAFDEFGEDRPDLWAPFVLTGRLFTKEELG
ncbi:CHAT domain-containing protein [Marinibacterium sp. SX1]|uniref:CHAT domain-containing protein n=1 Tax=Marinibacterium sp. SX1 TaxID=3388424 RepID=UPI003D1826CA